MEPLADWDRYDFSHGGFTHEVYRKGTGPGVIVMHELPGMTPEFLRYIEELADEGFTVFAPHLFGPIDKHRPMGNLVGIVARGCIRREFTIWARDRTSPIVDWLKALARRAHKELGGPGVGAVGMCFTGGFALAMIVDAPVVAPVVAQPALPLATVGTKGGRKRRGADIGLSPSDVVAVAQSDCPLLGLRFAEDPLVGSRFQTLEVVLGDRFDPVEFSGDQHATLTGHRQEAGVEKVLAFLKERLSG
jgi:dienelactone hydrolase